ncbi:MAG TPA: hypothetical protein VGL91_16280 [Acidobacteriota bacterium]
MPKVISLFLLLLLYLPGGLFAARSTSGCISFARHPIPSSDCRCFLEPESTVQLLTGQKSASLETKAVAEDFDAQLYDPAFLDGVPIQNSPARVLLQPPPGEYLVEVIVTGVDAYQRKFWLVLDRERMGPWKTVNGKNLSLVSWVSVTRGPVVLAVETDAPRYVLSALRWTSREKFEQQTAPRLMERARRWFRQPVYNRGIEGAFARVSRLMELLERARFSQNIAVRREALIGLGRVRYWLTAEKGDAEDIEETSQALRKAAALAPRDRILRQTLSSWCRGIPNLHARRSIQEDFCARVTPESWLVSLPHVPADAPDWAVTQRALMGRLNAITRWWVQNRQQANGELGGGRSADMELFGTWVSQALGFGDRDAARGVHAMADGIWAGGALEAASTERTRIIGSAEPAIDSQPLAVALDPANTTLRARLALSADCVKNWISPSPSGAWRFRGAWSICNQFDPEPERDIDVLENIRAVGPALWQAYLTQDPNLIQLLSRWGESWVGSMRQTIAGKPAGIFPPAVQITDGGYLVGSPRWWEPQSGRDTYLWSGAGQEAASSLLLALYDLTGDKRWLAVVAESFAPVREKRTQPPVALEIRANPQAFLEWRQRSGDSSYDEYFHYSPPAPANYAWLRQVRTEMTQLARNIEARHSTNFAMYTTEALFTDRVNYSLPFTYRLRLFGGETPRGDRYPMFAVTWPLQPADFARAVLVADTQHLQLMLYSFEKAETRAGIHLWKLAPATYRWRMESLSANQLLLDSGTIQVGQRGQLVTFPLPPRKEVILRIEPVSPPAPNNP